MENPFRLLVLTNIFCAGGGTSTLMSISDGICPYILSKDGKNAAYGRKINGKVFISRQSRHFLFIVIVINIFFHI